MLVTVAAVRASWSQRGVTLVLAVRILLAVGQEQFQPETSNFVPFRRRLVAGLSSRGIGFDPKSVCLIFVVDRMELGEVCLRVLRFSPFSIMPCHCYLHFGTTVTRMRNGPSLGTFQKAALFLLSKALHRKFLITFSFTLQTTLPQLFNLSYLHLWTFQTFLHSVTALRRGMRAGEYQAGLVPCPV